MQSGLCVVRSVCVARDSKVEASGGEVKGQRLGQTVYCVDIGIVIGERLYDSDRHGRDLPRPES